MTLAETDSTAHLDPTRSQKSHTQMNISPRDRLEFWVRFTCSFLFFGTIAAVGVLLYAVDSLGIPQSVAVWAVVSLAISLYAAKVGDKAWHRLLSFFQFWP